LRHQIIQRTFGIPDALHSLCPDADWKSDEETWESLVWLSPEIDQPNFDQVMDEVRRLQDDWDTNEYRRWRDINYPPIGDQLDALYHAGLFPPEMEEKIRSVKESFPKPE
jgi:hypothetical protein